MKILALDTATKVCSVAIIENDNILVENTINSGQNHSELLLGLIEKTLEDAKLEISDIDNFAISNGPGSFTGLRVACATAKAFAYTQNANVYEVCTLDSLAYNATVEHEKATVISIIDARRKQVYYAVYDLNQGNIERKLEYDCVDFTEVLELAKQYENQNQNVVFVGDAVELFKDDITAQGFNVLKDENVNAKAGSLKVGLKEENKKNFKSVKLFYFKKSQAERELEERLANNASK